MRIFLTSCDIDLWQVVLDGHMDPTSERHAWDDKANKAHTLNAKAMNALFYASSEIGYTRVSRGLIGQEIWQLLEVTHEGTSKVEESQISIHTYQYETFKIKKERLSTPCIMGSMTSLWA